MDNTSLSTDVRDDVTTSLSDTDADNNNLFYSEDSAIRVVSGIIGGVGIVGNLFVIFIYVFFIKITNKVSFAN